MRRRQRSAKDLLQWLTGRILEDHVTEEEVFEELFAEGIDADALFAAATAAVRRIRRKVRVMGIPLADVRDDV